MNAVLMVVNFAFDAYLMVVLLRLWLQLVRADFYNPFSQTIVKLTHPLVAPMRRVIPSIGRLDTATLVLALLVAVAKYFVIALIAGRAVNPIAVLINAPVYILYEIFQVVFWILLFRVIMSWVSQGRSPIDYVLMQLTEPMLAPIRKIIPPIGMFDLSILVALFLLKVLETLIFLDLLGGR